jgi:putative methyltransferase (TIGR04325 family)
MIPVVYIHLGSLPAFLFTSIKQALRYNKQVYLLTDTSVTIDNVTIVNVNDYLTHVDKFESVYKHMSSNTENFEKICIKRWIILSNFLNQNKIDVCYYSDSDVMLYANVSDVYENYKSYDSVYTLPEYQENFRWTASACCSFWKKETLNIFSEFILSSYSNDKIQILKDKWDYHQKMQIPGGVCDMTLLYLFSQTINFFSLSKVIENFAFDQNYLDDENYFKKEYELAFDSNIGRNVKKIIWNNNSPFAYNLIEQKNIQFFALTEFARYCDINKRSFKNKVYKLVNRVFNKISRIIKRKEQPHGWFGNYETWQLAEKECKGYDSDIILNKVRTSILKVRNGEAVYERDSVIFNEVQYSNYLIKAFKDSIENESLHVVDFGGSLGSTYFQHKQLFKDLKDLKWAVVEQKHFVDCGKKEIEIDNLKFYYTIDESLKFQSNQVLLLSSVIPYFKEPYELISNILKYDFEYIIIDRTAFIQGDKERITKQIVPEFIYKASYPSWFLNEQKFIRAFNKHYDLVFDFRSAFDPEDVLEDGLKVYRKGFYFKKRKIDD